MDMMEKVVEIGNLFDFYGRLLSQKQSDVVEQYYLHDLSLSEIGENLSISRQGVHDLLKRAESNLYGYEEKLGLVSKFDENKSKIRDMADIIDLLQLKIDKGDYKGIEIEIQSIKDISSDILD